jgi:proline dehydrogenase
MLEGLLTSIARRPAVLNALIALPGMHRLARRFVPGEDLASGLAAIRALNAREIKASLNLIGTHILDRPEAVAATEAVIEALRRIDADGLDSQVSVKLTHIGFDVDPGLARTHLERILDAAASSGHFVRIDMEESVYVDRTIELFEEMHDRYGPTTVGIAVQSYLRGRAADLDRLLDRGAAIRLVRGGYLEAADVVLRDAAEVDAVFEADIERLLRRGRQPAIATHNPRAIRRVRAVARDLGLEPGAFEFEMLYGVRTDLRAALLERGYLVRVYVPCGPHGTAFVFGCLRRVPGGVARRAIDRIRRRPELI